MRLIGLSGRIRFAVCQIDVVDLKGGIIVERIKAEHGYRTGEFGMLMQIENDFDGIAGLCVFRAAICCRNHFIG